MILYMTSMLYPLYMNLPDDIYIGTRTKCFNKSEANGGCQTPVKNGSLTGECYKSLGRYNG